MTYGIFDTNDMILFKQLKLPGNPSSMILDVRWTALTGRGQTERRSLAVAAKDTQPKNTLNTIETIKQMWTTCGFLTR